MIFFRCIELNILLNEPSPVSFYFFNVATRKFETTHRAHVVFLWDSTALRGGGRGSEKLS